MDAVAEEKNAHAGHRQRMKERLLRDGLDGFAGHEVFELLLYYALPYRDTNGLGHRLVDRFGSLVGVMEAEYADLIRVDGVSPHVATLIVLCGQMARRYAREQYAVGRLLYTTEDYGNCVLPWFIGEKAESVVQVSMDNRCRVLNTTRIFTGSVNSTQFSFRDLVRQALQDNATQIVLAHNHPNGHACFSQADVTTTMRCVEVLTPLHIRLLDHLVVSEDDYVSMAATPELAALFRTAPRCRNVAAVADAADSPR